MLFAFYLRWTANPEVTEVAAQNPIRVASSGSEDTTTRAGERGLSGAKAAFAASSFDSRLQRTPSTKESRELILNEEPPDPASRTALLIEEALFATDSDDREQALSDLGFEEPTEAVVAACLKALSDEAPGVRLEAALAIESLEATSVLPELEKLRNAETDPKVLRTMARTLYRWRRQEVSTKGSE